MVEDPVDEQAQAAIGAVRAGLTNAEIVAVYLYGSAVAGGLRPDSDLDLFVVTDRRITSVERAGIVERLMPISWRQTRPPAWRPLEVTVVAQPDVQPWRYPPRMDLQYGEWLRAGFLSGEIEPEPAENPDLGVLITMVRNGGRPLIGPSPLEVLDAVPWADLARGMVDGVPSLVSELADDTRNVLLTLARIWTTLATGEIRSKAEAADWVLSGLPGDRGPTMERARDLYRAGGYGDPWDAVEASLLAEHLVRGIEGAYRGLVSVEP